MRPGRAAWSGGGGEAGAGGRGGLWPSSQLREAKGVMAKRASRGTGRDTALLREATEGESVGGKTQTDISPLVPPLVSICVRDCVPFVRGPQLPRRDGPSCPSRSLARSRPERDIASAPGSDNRRGKSLLLIATYCNSIDTVFADKCVLSRVAHLVIV